MNKIGVEDSLHNCLRLWVLEGASDKLHTTRQTNYTQRDKRPEHVAEPIHRPYPSQLTCHYTNPNLHEYITPPPHPPPSAYGSPTQSVTHPSFVHDVHASQ